MKARKLRQLLGECVGSVEGGYIISHNDTKIVIGSAYVSDLIAVDKVTKKITYAMDFDHKGETSLTHKPLIEINKKIKELIEQGLFDDIIEGQDYIENPLPVFTYDIYDKFEIIETLTDFYDYPNITITGEVMYNNRFFQTKEHCINKAIESVDLHYSMLNRRFEELMKDLERNTKTRNQLLEFKNQITIKVI